MRRTFVIAAALLTSTIAAGTALLAQQDRVDLEMVAKIRAEGTQRPKARETFSYIKDLQ